MQTSGSTESRTGLKVGSGHTAVSSFLLVLRSEYVPEPKGLIGSSRADRASVWTCGEVENARGVAFEFLHSSHRRVLPQTQLVLREAMTSAGIDTGNSK